jgi:hypothetical protein
LATFGSAPRLVAVGFAIVLCAAACAGTSAPTNPPRPSGSHGVGGGGALTVGLSSNLDKLASYRFTESNVGTPGGGSPSPSGQGSYSVSGTVVTRPTASIWIRQTRAQYIVIGDLAWVSVDGATWMATDPQVIDLTSILPGAVYATWFDARASYFNAVGEESKNNVPCTHYKGNSTLGSMYVGLAGASSSFQADLWIARDGNYPVSGIFGYSTSAASQSGSWGFKFDITNVDDNANTLAAPTSLVAYPTGVASPTAIASPT